MSYLVLARKYRPRTFAEVAGQGDVTRVLRGAVAEGRVGHAYLFTGPRGTGKTTCARLFAKALNCEQGPAEEPCGTCDHCRALDSGREADVIEIDAATHTGVDDVRDLRDQASYVPLRARFKVYIVDEVHMLSRAAFNALLKTLEEPPPHVKFLFATTELHKVPDTIRSRCQILRLGPLPSETITARLGEVFAREGVEAQEGVAEELARRARGGMRDALSMADQLLALVGSSPRLADCDGLAGEGSGAVVDALVEGLLAGEAAAVLGALPRAEGSEAELLSGLLEHLRGCLLAALCGEGAPHGPGGDRAGGALVERGKRIGDRRLELWLQELLTARERMRLLPSHAALVLEMTLLDLCRAESTLDLDDLALRLEALEARLQAAPATPVPRAAQATQAAPAAKGETSAPGGQSATGGTGGPRVRTNSAADAWQGFLTELELASPSLHAVLVRRGRLEQYRSGRARVRLAGLGPDEGVLFSERRNVKTCSQAFSRAVGQDVEVSFEDTTQVRPGAEDPFTRKVADLFEGRIEE